MGRGTPKIWQEHVKHIVDIHIYDLPEDVEELDCLCSPEGPILDAQQLAAELFGASNTWFLCNGSTAGLMAAILALVRIHSRNCHGHQPSIVIVPRNCHKSVLQGCIISGAEVVYVTPVYDPMMKMHHGCRLHDIKAALATVLRIPRRNMATKFISK
jgi:arginine decarboxylase